MLLSRLTLFAGGNDPDEALTRPDGDAEDSSAVRRFCKA